MLPSLSVPVGASTPSIKFITSTQANAAATVIANVCVTLTDGVAVPTPPTAVEPVTGTPVLIGLL